MSTQNASGTPGLDREEPELAMEQDIPIEADGDLEEIGQDFDEPLRP